MSDPPIVQAGEWYKATVAKGSEDQQLRMKVAVRMERPMNMRHSGSDKTTSDFMFYF